MSRSSCTLYVGNLPGDTRMREVEDLFYKVFFFFFYFLNLSYIFILQYLVNMLRLLTLYCKIVFKFILLVGSVDLAWLLGWTRSKDFSILISFSLKLQFWIPNHCSMHHYIYIYIDIYIFCCFLNVLCFYIAVWGHCWYWLEDPTKAPWLCFCWGEF